MKNLINSRRFAKRLTVKTGIDRLEMLRSPRLRDDIARERAARSLREFVRQAWHVVEPSTPFVPGWHIDAIFDHLEAVTRGQIRNLLINVPPRHMKSLLVSVFWPAWEWIRAPGAALALQQLRGLAEHSRFGEVPAADRIALVSSSLGPHLLAHQGPERQDAVRQQPFRLSLIDFGRRLGHRRRRRPDCVRRPAQR